jgi:transcriptional regulator with XRE-family HTH domain
MNWKEAKEILKKDPGVLKEVERLEPFYQIIDQLLSLRIEKNLTQRELAALINTTQSCIARLESGNYNPTLRFLQKIADACDKKIEIRFIPKIC